MPYRVRPLRLSQLVNPMMRATELEARGDEQLNQGILSGLVALGGGIERRGVRREERRRFGEQMDLRERALETGEARFLLDYEEFRERQRNAQADATALTDEAVSAAAAAGIELELTGDVKPETVEGAKQAVTNAGGLEAVVGRIRGRLTGKKACGGPGQPP